MSSESSYSPLYLMCRMTLQRKHKEENLAHSNLNFLPKWSMTGVRTVSRSCFFLHSNIWTWLYRLKHYKQMHTKLFLFNHNKRERVRAPVTVIKGFYCHLFYQVLSKQTTSGSLSINNWSDFAGHYDHKKLINRGSCAYQDSLPDFASHCSQSDKPSGRGGEKTTWTQL